MPNQSEFTNPDPTVEITPIVDNGIVDDTYQSVCVHLMLTQDKVGSHRADIFEFLGDGFNGINAYYFLKRLWNVEHLGAYPELETLVQQYWMGPSLIKRLAWYAEGAQINSWEWDPEDPQFVEPAEQLTPEDETSPLISTGEERVAPDDNAGPFESSFQDEWSVGKWANFIEGEAERELAVDDDGTAFDRTTGEVVEQLSTAIDETDPFGVSQGGLEPPTWVTGGGWQPSAQTNAANTGENAVSQGGPVGDTAYPGSPQLTAFLIGYADTVEEPSVPCSKEEWLAYVETLRARHQALVQSKADYLSALAPNVDLARELWHEARGSKKWKS